MLWASVREIVLYNIWKVYKVLHAATRLKLISQPSQNALCNFLLHINSCELLFLFFLERHRHRDEFNWSNWYVLLRCACCERFYDRLILTNELIWLLWLRGMNSDDRLMMLRIQPWNYYNNVFLLISIK